MSGTSVDSIDAAAIEVELQEENTAIRFVKGISHPIPEDIRWEIFDLFEDGSQSLHRLTMLNMRLGSIFGDAALRLLDTTGLDADEVDVIGSHGQTIHHIAIPEEYCGDKVRGSLQIGEASVIAQKTGIPVVSDFRAGDIAAGGTGAPLVPFLDSILFGKKGKDIAAQNIGGIGNVTWLPRSGENIIAFDTGPGNMIIDLLVEKYTSGRLRFDKNGEIGSQGNVRQDLLDKWMKHHFLSQLPPKSTGREEFGTLFLSTYLHETEPSPDLIRTAEEFTALSISEAYRKFLPGTPEEIIVTGGGAHNPVILSSLSNYFKSSRVITGDKRGIDVDFKEAMAFALMGLWNILGKPNNVPEATGASRKVILGKLSRP